ncbi:DUF6500 family protein [Shinella sp. WSJ-2]|uniref:DUF6500 family protein n=1 Tax=Shinella sp. WSJ-2 TaxID=2303749 RepID=UPI0032AF1223
MLRTRPFQCDEDRQEGRGRLPVVLAFANRNTDLDRRTEAAVWWIKRHRLNHFENATKIRAMITSGL